MDNKIPNNKIGFDKERVKSGMKVERNSFIWEIENFCFIRKSTDLLERQKFQFSAGSTVNFETEWEFQLGRMKMDDDDNEEGTMGVVCILQLAASNTENAFASWHMKIKSVSEDTYYFGNEHEDVAQLNEYSAQTGRWWYSFIPENVGQHNLPLKNGTLVIELVMQLYVPPTMPAPLKISMDVASIEKLYSPKFIAKLQQDFANLLVSPPECSDVKTEIVLKDQFKFNVTSWILSARSPLFKKMFESKMTEFTTGNSGVLWINDISSKTMSVLLSFLYTGELKPDWRCPEVLADLVYAAGRCQLADLLEFFDEVLGIMCTKETAGKLMYLARKLSLKKAEKDIWEFVKKNISSLDEMIAFAKVADGDVDSV